MFSRRKKVALAITAAGLLTSAPAIAAGPPTDLHPGDRVQDHGVSVTVPKRGHFVSVEALTVSGSQILTVKTSLRGKVVVSEWGDEQTDPGTGSSGGPSDCNDDAYGLKAWRWNTTFNWYFNAGSTPGELNVDNAEGAIRDGARNIVLATNNCNRADNISATAAYQGRTNANVQIGSDNSCVGNGNGINSVGFGDLKQGTLGLACTWAHATPREVLADESDVRLNSADHKWIAVIGPNCSDRWSIEAVMTHERGHTFGLGHVSEDTHGKLTMSTDINGKCQNSESTLGLGDMKGLETKY
jgi:hypothetical protein